MFGVEGNDEFFVGFFFVGFVEDVYVGLVVVEGFGSFMEIVGEIVVYEGEFENIFESVKDRYLVFVGFGWNFDFDVGNLLSFFYVWLDIWFC